MAEPAYIGSGASAHASIRFALWAAAGAAAAMVGVFAFEGSVGLNLADEGYLWYGAQRVLAGEVPLRDFISYDPGRYYWSAALMGLFGDRGILSLRMAAAVFQAFGLLAAVLLLRRAAPRASALFLMLAGATLLVWMVPRHKVFDASIAIFLIAGLSLLIEKPTRGRYFLIGALVGAVAMIGRNHGVYGCFGALAAMGVLAWQRSGAPLTRALPAFCAGVLVGYLPLLLAVLAVPGLQEAFIEGIRTLFEYGGTNLALPVPWPWRVDAASQSWIDILRHVLIGSLFIAVPLFSVVGIAYVLRTRLGSDNATLAAAAFLALPYAHFVFSRADLPHLAQGIFPLLIGLMAAPLHSERRRLALAVGLLAVSVLAAAPLHPGWVAWKSDWRAAKVGRDELVVPPDVADDLALLERLVAKYASDGRTFLVAPHWPGAYAAFDRKAPVREIYPLFPRPRAFEEAEIARIRAARPAFIAVRDAALDGLEERRFRNTHPLLNRFIVENFEPASEAQGTLQVFLPRQRAR